MITDSHIEVFKIKMILCKMSLKSLFGLVFVVVVVVVVVVVAAAAAAAAAAAVVVVVVVVAVVLGAVIASSSSCSDRRRGPTHRLLIGLGGCFRSGKMVAPRT
jgi:hypothetical protein